MRTRRRRALQALLLLCPHYEHERCSASIPPDLPPRSGTGAPAADPGRCLCAWPRSAGSRRPMATSWWSKSLIWLGGHQCLSLSLPARPSTPLCCLSMGHAGFRVYGLGFRAYRVRPLNLGSLGHGAIVVLQASRATCVRTATSECEYSCTVIMPGVQKFACVSHGHATC